MNTTTSILGHAAQVSTASPGSGTLQRLWLGLQRLGHRRAVGHLEQLSQRYELSDPNLARQLRQAAQDCREAFEPLVTGHATRGSVS